METDDPDVPPLSPQHRWVKVCEHRYVCTRCGAHRINAQDEHGRWAATWITPDGETRVRRHAPVCEPGPETADLMALASRMEAEGG